MADEDRRRLHRAVEYKHQGPGQYSTDDAMHGIQKVGRRSWQRGVRQPYHTDGQFDFSHGPTFRRLRDAQTAVEAQEAERPRSSVMQTPFNDRRHK